MYIQLSLDVLNFAKELYVFEGYLYRQIIMVKNY